MSSMSSQSSSKVTTTKVATITQGPATSDLRFQGWYAESDGSLSAVQCPSGQSYFTSDNFADCCEIGSTCTDLWTSCDGSVPAGASSDVCGDQSCQTLSIFDQFPLNIHNNIQSQIICAAPDWGARSLYRTYISATTATAVTLVSATPAQSGQLTLPTITGISLPTIASTDDSGSGMKTAISQAWIAGAVIGSLLFAAIVGALLFFTIRRRLRRSATMPAYKAIEDDEQAFNRDAKSALISPLTPCELTVPEPIEMHGQYSDDTAYELQGDEASPAAKAGSGRYYALKRPESQEGDED